MQITRTGCRILSILTVTLFVVAAAPASAAQSAQLPIDGSAIPKYVDPLPDIEVIQAGADPIDLEMREFQAQVLPTGMPKTWVWGYLKPGQSSRASYIGPVIVATRGTPTEIRFVNALGTATSTNVLAYRYSSDQTIHWADPLGGGRNDCHHMAMYPTPLSPCTRNYAGAIPAVPHLHGGQVPPELDGGPDAWVTSDGLVRGDGYYSKDGTALNWMTYRYPNVQEGAPLWFHDHTLGVTRLGVYAGLAGVHLITDPVNDPKNLPPLTPLVIQDRMFDTNGQLFFTADSAGGVLWALNPEHPYWNPEFVGDVVVVNGKAWPYLDVERKRYTFLLLNGSNARTYELFFSGSVANAAAPMWVIGTDGGYLDRPQPAKKVTVMPGERYLVVVDFATVPTGTRVTLRNTAKTPYPGGVSAPASTTGEVLEVRVGAMPATPDTSFDPAAPAATLRGGAGQGPALTRLVDPVAGALAPGVTVHKTRQLTLNEILGVPQLALNPVTGVWTSYPGGPLEVVLNNTSWNGQRITGIANGMFTLEPIPGFIPDTGPSGAVNWISETPAEGETEIWEIVNTTADAHPIHLHLVQFQLMNRQTYDTKAYLAAYAAAFPGGSIDPMSGLPYPPGVFMPTYGPPLPYTGGNPRALGGNPDIAATGKNGNPIYLRGAPQPPLPQESGWKDTVIVYPGQVTRLAVRWAPTDLPVSTPVANATFPFNPASSGNGYVWHCHILDHEDNEMMRPDLILANSSAVRTFVRGSSY